MRTLLIAVACVLACLLSAEEAWPDQDTVIAIRKFASEGHPEGQVLMGFLFELGLGVEQNYREAALWYAMAAHDGNRLAFLQWGILTFFGRGVPKNEQMGLLLMYLGPYDDLFPDMTEEELATVHEIRALWNSLDFAYSPLSFTPTFFAEMNNCHKTPQRMIRLASDRPDPMDSNERIYGPGTGDWNTGVMRSEYEQLQRDYRELLRGIEAVQASANTMKAKDLRAQIERLQADFIEQRHGAYKEWIISLGAAMAAGLSIPYPIAALIEAYGAMEGFKSAADRYVKSIDVEKEVNRLLEIERSLEKAQSFGGRER